MIAAFLQLYKSLIQKDKENCYSTNQFCCALKSESETALLPSIFAAHKEFETYGWTDGRTNGSFASYNKLIQKMPDC